MPVQLFTNNANSTLAAPVGNTALSIQVAAGEGVLFPSPAGGDWFLATLCKVTSGVETAVEIVKVTAKATDVFTILRAQEGTTAQTYTTGDRISLRMTAAIANSVATALGLSGVVKVASGAFAASVAGTDHVAPGGSIGIGATGTTPVWTGTREVKLAMGANNIDCAAGNVFTKTISGATTLTVSNVPAADISYGFILKLTNGGSAVVTFWSGIKRPGGTVKALTVSGRDNLYFSTDDGGTTWDLVSAEDMK